MKLSYLTIVSIEWTACQMVGSARGGVAVFVRRCIRPLTPSTLHILQLEVGAITIVIEGLGPTHLIAVYSSRNALLPTDDLVCVRSSSRGRLGFLIALRILVFSIPVGGGSSYFFQSFKPEEPTTVPSQAAFHPDVLNITLLGVM